MASIGGIIIREGRDDNKQMQKYQELLNREFFSTRYIKNICLYNLGIYNCVYCLLENLNLHHLFNRKDNTYETLTREILTSLIYTVRPNTTITVGTVKFLMFNVEYEFTTY